jgi:hypothetical protein
MRERGNLDRMAEAGERLDLGQPVMVAISRAAWSWTGSSSIETFPGRRPRDP